MEKYFEINKSGQNIRCKLYYGKSAGIEKAVLFVHGKPIKKLTGDNILDQFMDEIYKL